MYYMKVWLVNCVPLSVMTLFYTPKWQTSPLKNLMADCVVTFLTASTSGHFVNLSNRVITHHNNFYLEGSL